MALLGWGLMTLGAFVRVSESGLGCPDWPSCHGQLVVGGNHALIEEVHRWVAAVLTVGVMALALAVFRNYHTQRRLTWPMALVLALLVLQVALGGVTVLLGNVAWTVVLHYGAAALLVASLVFVAVRLAFPTTQPANHDAFSRLVVWFVVLSFGLLLAGSTVANTDSHTACGTGFPLCNGTLVPSLDHHVLINLLHRAWAVLMLSFSVWVLTRSRRDSVNRAIRRAATTVTVLFVVQAAMGIAVIDLGENSVIEVLHSSLASLTWTALAVLLSLARTLSHDAAPTRGISVGSE